MDDSSCENEWRDRTAHSRVTITEADIDKFVELSGDRSRIHIDPGYARSRGFRDRVVHGALLASYISGLVGTKLPGDRGIMQGMQLSFRLPCYPGDVIRIDLRVADFHPSVNVLELTVAIRRRDGDLLVTGEIQSGVT